MRVICWNLEKRGELVDWVFDQKNPDVALFQEWVGQLGPHASTNSVGEGVFTTVVGKQGRRLQSAVAPSFEVPAGVAGTSILASELKWFVSVRSPKGDYRLQFWKGMIHKATAIAQLGNGLTLVSFHGYNGTLQGRRVEDLIAHIEVVMQALPDPGGSIVWAGDFNTFTNEHERAVEAHMTAAGFNCDIRVPYDSKKNLDFVFTRNCKAELLETGKYESDHPFIIFDVLGI